MRLFATVSLVLACCLQSLSAQAGANPLIGKTVHYFYQPVYSDTVWLQLPSQNYSMAKEGVEWVSLKITESMVGTQTSNTNFKIANSWGQSHWTLGKGGLESALPFTAEDFQGGEELWILIDPAGPASAPPVLLTVPPKVINVLNPWPATAPVLMLPGNTKRSMRVLPDHCGWFTAFLLNPTDLNVFLQEINGTDSYGKGGLRSTTPFDMAAEFAAKGSTLWLDTELNTWSAAYPNKDGICRFMMAATVRDFNENHPDFDFGNLTGDHSAPGMVQAAIHPATRRPARSAVSGIVNGTNLYNNFDSWWNTDNTNANPALRSYETCVDIPISKSDDGLWEYDSYKTPERGFWPIENFTNPNNAKTKASCYNNPATDQSTTDKQPATNMNFCMESHANFVYRPGQKFTFRGDDDFWVFINGKLVLDLGGIHIPKTETVDLDNLGLIPGQTYMWDLFYCDRQPCSSSLRFKTSIYFRQQIALDTVLTRDPATGITSVKVIKRTGGTGSCTPLGGEVTVSDATNLIYELWTATGTRMETLTSPSLTHGGGIAIATPRITVDTSKIVNLVPGNYRIVAYEPANQTTRVEIGFQVSGTAAGVRSALPPGSKQALKHPLYDALGRASDLPGLGKPTQSSLGNLTIKALP